MDTTVEIESDVEVDGGSVPLSELVDQVCSRSANLTAAEGEWLLLVAEFDRREGWVPSGHRSCADWLAWEVGIDMRTAYEKVRVAHVLVQFPDLASAMSTGVLSYAKARAITRIARPDNIDKLLELAATSTATQVENVVASYRRSEPSAEAAAERAFRERAMSWRLDGATAVITMRLPVDMASELFGMLGEFIDHNDLHTPDATRRVDALMVMGDMAVVALEETIGPSRRPRYLASVHLTPNAVDPPTDDNTPADPGDTPAAPGDPHGSHPHAHGSGGGVCCVQPGGNTQIPPAGIAPSTARRMLCDAAIQGFRTNIDGEAEVGMATPTVSAKLKRALLLRDGGCRFPGCTMAAWVDAHHIQHWLDFGPTRPKNLVCLCRRHHRLMHEGRWNITGDPAGNLYFHQPDGTIIAAQPPVRLGDAMFVNEHKLSGKLGRCGWTARRCNVKAITEMILDTERARRRSRACTPSRDKQPAPAESP